MGMTTTIFEACKKRKRTPIISVIHNFTTTTFCSALRPSSCFSTATSTAMGLNGPFRENIRDFLKHCAEIEDYRIGGDPVWCSLLLSESNGVVFPLYVVEENVRSSSSHSSSRDHHHQPLCDHCRCIGWSHHFVSKRNYHLIIPKDDKWNKPLMEESLQLQTHLLHGLIHCNGFGHLLCVNVCHANSKYLHGQEIMNLWDHLCAILQTREISVEDLLKKGTMDLRLLHGVAYGQSWFGKWGYKFCHGSFGVTRQKYDRAIEILTSLDLSMIIHDFINTRQGKLVKKIITMYSDVTESQLVTISDLFQFMLAFNSTPRIQRKMALALPAISPKSSTNTTHQDKPPLYNNYSSGHNSFACHQPETCLFMDPNHHDSAAFIAKFNDSRWPARRLEGVLRVILDTLKSQGSRMGRQKLRDAVREHIGDTGLIDFVIKNIDKVMVENQIFRRAIDPITRKIEISLQDVVNKRRTEKKMETCSCSDIPVLEPGLDVIKDLQFLYNYVLLGYPDSHLVSEATKAVLDSKHFIKEWQFMGNKEDSLLRLVLRVRPSYRELVKGFTRPLPPGELLVVPENVTADELKLMVQCALRDTYCVMDKFVVRDIQIGRMEEREYLQDVLTCGVEQDVQVWVWGCGLDLDTKLRYQGGADDWMVDCVCGAKDDDGERMVACDDCRVWQHTRCNAIEDDQAALRTFLCYKCIGRLRKKKH